MDAYCDECASEHCAGHELCDACDGDVCNECGGCDCHENLCDAPHPS